MIKIVHTADIHIGVENYGRIDNATGLHTRLLDFAASLSFCVDQAIAEKVDLFVLAGDAYKTASPTPTQQKFLLQNLLRLQAAGIAVIIIVGNHDHPLSFGKAHALDVYADLPLNGFYVFARPGKIVINTRNGLVQVVGIPWPSRQNLLAKNTFCYKDFTKITDYISSAVTEIIAQLAAELDPAIPAILAGHLTVSTGVFSGSEKRAVFGNDPLFLPANLGIAPFNYVALGHLHRQQSLNTEGQVPIVYAGSIERIDFGEVRDKKGFVLVEIDTFAEGNGKFKRIANVSFRPIRTRKMLEINVYLKDNGEFFTKQILDEVKKIDITDAIVKLFYHLPVGALDTTDLGLIYRALASAWYVAGVIPVVKTVAKNSRLNGENNQKISLPALLEKYFSYKGVTKERTSQLLTKAEEIIAEVTLEQNKEEG